MTDEIVRHQGETGIQREGFGATEVERRNETSSTAMAAQAQAEVTARFIVAAQRPRNVDDVRTRLLRECSRPSFARKCVYALPRGDKPGRLTGTRNVIEGLTVRFAEAAIRLSGNILQQTKTIYDDDYKRLITVTVTDLETNACYSRDIAIEKTVERAKPRDKAVILGQRTNSAGNVVYIVQATEDELLQKEGVLISKTFRTLGMRLVPADIIEDCEQRIVTTNADQTKKNPDAERKAVLDGFAGLNVLPSMLAEYLGHDVSMCSPAEIDALRALYVAVKDGETTWAEVIGSRAEPEKEAEKKTSGLVDRIKAQAKKPPAADAFVKHVVETAAKADVVAKVEPKPADPLPPDDDLGGRL